MKGVEVMKTSKIISLVVLVTVCFIYPVSANENFNFNGHIETSVLENSSRLEHFFPSTSKIGCELEFKMNWFLYQNTNLHLQLNHFWDYDLKTDELDFCSKVERIFLNYSFLPGTNIRIGKQRIGWGNGYYTRPTDFFNPEEGLLQTETNGTGINALMIQNFQSDNNWTFVLIPPLETRDYALGLKIKRITYDYDVSINGFYNQENIALGLNGARTFYGINLYSSLALVSRSEELRWRGLVGGNSLINVDNNAMLFLELLTDDYGTNEVNYEVSLGGSISPIDKLSSSMGIKFNIKDYSAMWIASADYLIEANITLGLEGIVTTGSKESKYGSFPIENQINFLVKQYF